MVLIVLLVVVLIAGFLAYVATRPDSFRWERSTTIDAPAETIYAQIVNFHNWLNWSPWEGLDPNLKRTYSGPESGVGASYAWSGNGKAGSGSMDISVATPFSKVVVPLHFTAPFKAENTAEFTLAPEGSGTRVTWAMYGPSPFISKLFIVVMNADSFMGKTFHKGLASLKAVSEKAKSEA